MQQFVNPQQGGGQQNADPSFQQYLVSENARRAEKQTVRQATAAAHAQKAAIAAACAAAVAQNQRTNMYQRSQEQDHLNTQMQAQQLQLNNMAASQRNAGRSLAIRPPGGDTGSLND